MELNALDLIVFLVFFAVVIAVSLIKGRRVTDSEGFFLAGRSLTWPLIGLSIVAANLSTEQFVGMAGQGAGDVGLAVSAWQLTGSVGIVLVAFTLLPRFLRAGIYTMPEYLEFRFNPAARAIMALFTVLIYATVTITAVLYSGGLTLATIFGFDLVWAVWIVGAIATLYTAWGGLRAVAWADLLLGTGLLVGGLLTMFLVFRASGGVSTFFAENEERLHMVLPADHPSLPWTGILLGMWIPIIYYCGLNQFIVQRTLAAKNLRQGQMGVIFAAGLWLLVPFAIVIPGIAAKQLYGPELEAEADKANAEVLVEFEANRDDGCVPGEELVFEMDADWRAREPGRAAEIDAHNKIALAQTEAAGVEPETRSLVGYRADAAYPVLIRQLIPAGIRGFLFAAIAGAVISSLASMLNSASTIFTIDLFKRHIKAAASEQTLVRLGRVMTVIFVVIGCLLAPALTQPRFKGVFNFIQEFQGYISPGIVAAFLVGISLPRAPRATGAVALLASAPIYGLLHVFCSGSESSVADIHFLIRLLITFGAVCAIAVVMTILRPMPEPRTMPENAGFDMTPSRLAPVLGALIILAVVAFFVVFR